MPRIICHTVNQGDWECQPSDVVTYIVVNSGVYVRDTAERLQCQLDKLSEIVALLAAELPAERLVEIANATHFEKFRTEQDV